ncbi:hypothetical protein EU546_05185 [Candidatus Thorarchaeota archaeon]|nr:MAG: hypothetical protein EU546_05185 [Candidatus Thorarchaeota archaeon]
MRIQIDGKKIPYPLGSLRGRLLLAGLSELQAAQAIHEILTSEDLKDPEETDLQKLVLSWLATNKLSSVAHYENLLAYDRARSRPDGPPPIIVAIEGASATGKSMIALDLLTRLNATRYISTDTVRHMLRGMFSETSHPELHCHTYQAFRHKQEGPTELHETVRGFISQTNLVQPKIMELTHRVLLEGAMGVVEGVHMIPGSLHSLGSSAIEVLVSPSEELHEAMFQTKRSVGKLKSVSGDEGERRDEFEATCRIQEFMLSKARIENVTIVEFEHYEGAVEQISSRILETVDALI